VSLTRLICLVVLAGCASPAAAFAQPSGPASSDLDAFMARVLERRDENWRRSHDYILDEQERVAISGPAGIRLFGQGRDFTWYIRDGYFVRSPVRSNGVAPSDEERRAYEARWIERERKREERAKSREAGRAGEPSPAEDLTQEDVTALVREGSEPRFVSEAYFLQFKFEPGNYYLAGREAIDGREVLRIEYFPKRLFAEGGEITVSAGGTVPDDRPRRDAPPEQRDKSQRRSRDEHDVDDEDMLRRLNKVAVITLWVDPVEHQIVKFTFDNVGMGFLPGQWLVRVGETSASMVMGRVFEGVWLPREITMRVDMTLASGTYEASFERRFSNYRRAETSARIRSYRPLER